MSSAVRPRGFTMIELVIGLSMGVIVIGTLVAVLGTVLRENRRARAHAELQRDADFVAQLLTQEIRLAGLGVPTSQHVDAAFGASAPSRFDARRVLVAESDEMIIVGDQPRPDANYPAFGLLHDRANNSLTRISWHTENNGSCIPGACTMATSSIFFPGGEECTSNTARTCPWYGRLKAGDRIQIIDGGGKWGHTAMTDLTPVTSGGLVSANLSISMDTTGGWTNTTGGTGATDTGPAGIYGQGWVTSIDRVAYWFDAGNNRIMRRQCWGDPDPEHANWPDPTATAIPGSMAVNPTGGFNSICPPDEIIARHVDAVDFRYLDPTGTDMTGAATAADKNDIARIEWTITFGMVDATLGRPVNYTAVGSVRLQNFQASEP